VPLDQPQGAQLVPFQRPNLDGSRLERHAIKVKEQGGPESERFKSKKPLLRQIFTCCSHRQPPVLDASDRDQMVCHTPNNGTLPTNNQDFETVIVIKMYMKR